MTEKINLKDCSISGKTYELIINFENLNKDFSMEIKSNRDNRTLLKYDYLNKIFTLNRENSGENLKGVRKCILTTLSKIHIFSDNSCVEIFLNDGEEVFTANIFSEGEEIILDSQNASISSIEFYEI